MASLSQSQAAYAEPVARPRPRTRKKARKASARGGILWIVVGGILLAGVVFVNVAVLQLNLRLDSANSDRSKLIAQTSALQTQYSQLMSTPRVTDAATRELGLKYDAGPYEHLNLATK
jgi:cell division protein FtsL